MSPVTVLPIRAGALAVDRYLQQHHAYGRMVLRRRMDLAGPGDTILDPQRRMNQGQQFGLSLDGTEDCQPQHRLTGGVFGAVAKDDADDQDQQSLRNIRYCILNWLASSSWINSWIFVSFSLKSTCIDNSHKHGKCLATNDWLYAWLMLAWPLDWHIDWFSRF